MHGFPAACEYRVIPQMAQFVSKMWGFFPINQLRVTNTDHELSVLTYLTNLNLYQLTLAQKLHKTFS